jgi:hypothetical protein
VPVLNLDKTDTKSKYVTRDKGHNIAIKCSIQIQDSKMAARGRKQKAGLLK